MVWEETDALPVLGELHAALTLYAFKIRKEIARAHRGRKDDALAFNLFNLDAEVNGRRVLSKGNALAINVQGVCTKPVAPSGLSYFKRLKSNDLHRDPLSDGLV